MPRATLIGYRATGKTSVARALAGRLGVAWIDADLELAGRCGRSIAKIIASEGEPGFRARESALLEELLDNPACVLATGGGVVLAESNRRLLERAGRPIVWLTADAATIRRRIAADPVTATTRPALGGSDVLEEVATALAQREPLYAGLADLVIDTSEVAPQAIAQQVVAWLEAGA